MITITIDASDAEQKLAQLDLKDLARAIADEVDADLLQPALRRAPSARPQRQPFVSDKQRRKVMALVREGKIPYQRTGRATDIDNWPKTPTPDGLERTGAFPYAELLRGPKQAPYHAGNWPDVETIAQAVEAQAEIPAAAATLDVLEKAGLT